MFPLQLIIKRNDGPAWEEMPSDGTVLPVTPTPLRYHVVATVLDTDRKRTISYEFWSMIEPSENPFEDIGRITMAPTSAQIENLRGLRDALNEILED
jgi:hypothetical protein